MCVCVRARTRARFFVKGSASHYSLTAGEVETAPCFYFEKHFDIIVSYCDNTVGLKQQMRPVFPQFYI
jgi:hypothetical protein